MAQQDGAGRVVRAGKSGGGAAIERGGVLCLAQPICAFPSPVQGLVDDVGLARLLARAFKSGEGFGVLLLAIEREADAPTRFVAVIGLRVVFG